MPMVLWTRYFLEAQGYIVNGCDMCQDNQRVVLLEKNGRASSGKRTRHINIRYFFVTDRVKSGEVEIKYCPTDEMVRDYFTKPLQCSKFRKFRDAILNIQSTERDDVSLVPNDSSQECVGEPISPALSGTEMSDSSLSMEVRNN